MWQTGQLAAWTAAMRSQGTRRLALLAGDDAWGLEQACRWQASLPGDWLWLSASPPPAGEFKPCMLSAARSLLGQEFRHAVLDARHGLDAQALAILAGTLQAGSWLLLLAPPYAQWPELPDADSVRWSDCPAPIATPHFIHYLQACMGQDADVLLARQGQPWRLPALPDAPCWQAADGQPLPGQAAALRRLLNMDNGVAAVIAPRGRGKSALAGMLIAQLGTMVTVTAPAKAASEVLTRYAGAYVRFMAPDALTAQLTRASATTDWLVVDEAAAIPGPQLLRLVEAFPRVLLTTTVQGYEGTGRGFLLKLCAGLPNLRLFHLEQPLRWAVGCPLERIIDTLLAFDDAQPIAPEPASLQPERVTTPHSSVRLPLYRLLASAHYRTAPNDLRRLLDAPGQTLWRSGSAEAPGGALWATDEGGLDANLSRAVWAGSRRPRGNLVAQSLAAHGNSPLAATLRGRRISRIAVLPAHQRQGIGRALVAIFKTDSTEVDYLSVSFGYTAALYQFWQQAGFQIVRLGTHQEASSGCYTAMALIPVSAAGHDLVCHEAACFARDLAWILPHTTLTWPQPPLPAMDIDENDWLALAGFAFAQRPLEASLGCLGRLLRTVLLPLSALRGELEQSLARQALCQQFGFNGRKALLDAQRRACAEGLQVLNPERCRQLQRQVAQWKNFE